MAASAHPSSTLRHGAARYREMEVLTATPGQLVVLVYDHLLTSLRRTLAAHDANDIERRFQELERARDAVAELLSALDREKGGEIAANLASLYTFLLAELVEYGSGHDRARLARLLPIITDLRDAFGRIAAPAQTPTGGVAAQ